jgi:long-chain acyl-CoA synthetase
MEAAVSFNLATMLTETAIAAPDATAHTFMGAATSYRELDEQSGRLAAGLLESGLTPGQVVALQLPNLPQFPAAYFGVLKAGMVLMPLNPLLKAPEIAHHLADSAAAIVIGFDSIHQEAPL